MATDLATIHVPTDLTEPVVEIKDFNAEDNVPVWESEERRIKIYADYRGNSGEMNYRGTTVAQVVDSDPAIELYGDLYLLGPQEFIDRTIEFETDARLQLKVSTAFGQWAKSIAAENDISVVDVAEHVAQFLIAVKQAAIKREEELSGWIAESLGIDVDQVQVIRL